MAESDELGLAPGERPDAAYARALKIAALVNLVIFGAEVLVAIQSGSVALWADAVDFLEDTILYTVAFLAIGASLRTRAAVAGVTALVVLAPALYALWLVIRQVIWGVPPSPTPMGAMAVIALIANLYCAWLLLPHRKGDAAQTGVWLSTRNDALANIAVIAAAVGVAAFESIWPDVLVGLVIALVNIWAATVIIRRARAEWAAASDVSIPKA
jgi:Co/Zn/Cd efflux system component